MLVSSCTDTALSALHRVVRCYAVTLTDTLLRTYTHALLHYTTLLSTGPLLNKSIAKLGPQVPYYIAMYTKRSSSNNNSSSSELACRDKCGFETATTYISPQHGALDWLLVPSFLYSYAIEDPLVDSKFLNFQENDALLLLTTGYVLHYHYTTCYYTNVFDRAFCCYTWLSALVCAQLVTTSHMSICC
jgi:hypothetical protein